MNNPHRVDRPDLIEVLDNFGKEICNDRKDYFTSLTTSSSFEGCLIDFSLYILAPEIEYEYRVINVELLDIENLRVRVFTLATNQTESYDINISNGTIEFQNKLYEISNLGLFKLALQSLIDQIELRREYRASTSTFTIRNKIVSGQARIATLMDGQRINVGWIRIEGDEVFYYTGKGLREIYKPNMNEEEKKKAAELQKWTEEQLIKGEYIAKRKLSDFKDIE
jgi:hypothetical protein